MDPCDTRLPPLTLVLLVASVSWVPVSPPGSFLSLLDVLNAEKHTADPGITFCPVLRILNA